MICGIDGEGCVLDKINAFLCNLLQLNSFVTMSAAKLSSRRADSRCAWRDGGMEGGRQRFPADELQKKKFWEMKKTLAHINDSVTVVAAFG